jgi:hypothetical protein
MADHDKAENRANKMKKLFKQEYYDPIMVALNSNPKDQNAFNKTMEKAGFDETEIKWLWRYLQHCSKTAADGWGQVTEEAATSGW